MISFLVIQYKLFALSFSALTKPAKNHKKSFSFTSSQYIIFLFTCLTRRHGPCHRSPLKEHEGTKMLSYNTTHHRVGISWNNQSMLVLNKHSNNAPATTAFGHRHAEALHREKWRLAKRIRRFKWADKNVHRCKKNTNCFQPRHLMSWRQR